MLVLDSNHVYMNQIADNKNSALRLLSNILQQDGLTTSHYLIGLKDRERQSPTYLGQGIAIPHGTIDSRQEILQTGIRLVHFPQGVVWTDAGDRVYLAVVIAAKSDEHLQVLQLLTKSLGDHDLSHALQNAQSAEQILKLINATPPHLYLHERLIQYCVHAQDIDDVLWSAQQCLKQAQCVQAGFLSSLNIEQAFSLQDQIWCIVGERFVNQSAVSIVHLEHDIPFNHQQRLKTLVCIASDCSLDRQKLSQLMAILFQINTQNWSNSQQIAQDLGIEQIPHWTTQSVILRNAHGLHARPATALSTLCQQFDGQILVCVDQGESVSAKSLSKLLSLGASCGQTLYFMAEPHTTAEQHLSDIIQAVAQGLGEDIPPISLTAESTHQHPDQYDEYKVSQSDQNHSELKLQDDTQYHGIPASNGLAFGIAHIIQAQHFNFERFTNDIPYELSLFQSAIKHVKTHLQDLIQQAQTQAIAEIFSAHLALLEDEDLLNSTEQLIKIQSLTAAAAWQQHIEHTAQIQASLQNPLLAERADDLRDIGQRVLSVLCHHQEVNEPQQPYILIKYDLLPSDVAQLDKNKVIGILTAVGGSSAHSAIIARALGIPAIVGAGDAILNIQPNQSILLDGEQGCFYINPNQALVESSLLEQKRLAELQALALEKCHLVATTLDDYTVEVASNLGDVYHTQMAMQLGADAVGLLRTELLFMSHTTAPTEEQQEQYYRIVFDALMGKPLVVRTLDIGGDKPLAYISMPKEENPFLGIRGIRLTLRQPDLLRTQLRALIRAADNRPLRIMFPMIGRIEEWRAAKAILDDILLEIPCQNLQIGMMIEIPSAVLLTPILAKEVDFFSIGTNDLTQYVLAIDRGHPELSAEADALHPSILMMIHHTIKFAHLYGKWVGVCGELASDRKAVPILLGLGIDELSMSPNQIAIVKAQIRELNFKQCQMMAKQCLNCATADEVRHLSTQFLGEN